MDITPRPLSREMSSGELSGRRSAIIRPMSKRAARFVKPVLYVQAVLLIVLAIVLFFAHAVPLTGSRSRPSPDLPRWARQALRGLGAGRPRQQGLVRGQTDPGSGFTSLDLVGANHLFRLVSAANETRSLVVSSNWEFEQWTNFLPDVTAASAILDRILHHCEVVILNGDSYRLRQAKGMVRPKS